MLKREKGSDVYTSAIGQMSLVRCHYTHHLRIGMKHSTRSLSEKLLQLRSGKEIPPG